MPAGRLTQATSDLVITYYTYDEQDRLIDMKNVARKTADGTRHFPLNSENVLGSWFHGKAINSANYESWPMAYDLIGNRTYSEFEIPPANPGDELPADLSGSVDFIYNNRGELTNEMWHVGSESPSFTDFSDDGKLNARGYSPGGMQDYQGDQMMTGTYDTRGNQTQLNLTSTDIPEAYRKSVGMTYDGLNRMITATVTTGTDTLSMSYGYLADGHREYQRKTTTAGGSVTVAYVYDGDHVIAEILNGNLMSVSLWGANGLVARGIRIPTDDEGGLQSTFKVMAYTFDPSGNAIGEHLQQGSLDSHQSILVRDRVYDAYGEVINQDLRADFTGPTSLLKYFSEEVGFGGQAGYVTDPTGLICCAFRYYDPVTGRWLSRDPIGLEGGLNEYEYCDGNPVMKVDPSGLDTRSQIVAVYGKPRRRMNAAEIKNYRLLIENQDRRIKLDLKKYFYFIDALGTLKVHQPDMPSVEEINRQLLTEKVLTSYFAAGAVRRPKPSLVKEWEQINMRKWPVDELTGRPYVADHIQAFADGGTDTADNIQPVRWQELHSASHSANGDFARWSREAWVRRKLAAQNRMMDRGRDSGNERH